MKGLELKNLRSVLGKGNKIDFLNPIEVRQEIGKTLSGSKELEVNKNKLDLKPNIDFVSDNKSIFETGLNEILNKEPAKESKEWSQCISFSNTEKIAQPQVAPEECKNILARMPRALIELSNLKTINYQYGSLVPIPDFDEKGNLTDSKCSKLVPIYDFPGEEHPSRILIGNSDGENIFPTPIPKSILEDERASYLYQVYVLLHEFFHTIDYPRRDPREREKVLLEVDGQQFTLQDWWLAFEELILSEMEPKCVSSYANTYFDSLNKETKESNYKKFTEALAEQICETFVAYELNIISNDEEWTNFRSESFGNNDQLEKFKKKESESANLKWLLMDKLCRAKLVKNHRE